MGATPGLNKERKKALEKKGSIRCGYCPYNRVENAKRRPKDDRHKNPRRK